MTTGRSATWARQQRSVEKMRRPAQSFETEMRRRKAEMLEKTRERRAFSSADFELREAPGGVVKFSGYASVTETPYEVGHFTETIKRGAFKRTLSESPDVQLLLNHGTGGSGMPIARTNRNMVLTEDDRGLRVDADLDAEDPDVVLLARKMGNGLIDQMSFAFQVTDQEWSEDYSRREIKAASIHRGDVSVVNQGANPASTGSIRGRQPAKTPQQRELIQRRQERAVARYHRKKG
jgi:HK97 family phage prohead protease